MLKFLKESTIMLLICLVLLLLLAVIFYEYIPSRKVVSEITKYVPSSKVSQQLSDNIDKLDAEVILTFEQGGYEVTSSDLNKYKITEDYVPGKANPFAEEAESVSGSTSTSNNSSSSSTKTSSSANASKNTKSSEYIRDKGTK